jgi:SAM-dependent methyltransferase
VKQGAEFFDENYFEGTPPEHKSNYTRVGGYSNFASGLSWNEVAKTLLGDDNPACFFVLDVGCAYGLLVKAFRDLGAQAYGVDISQFAIDKADPEIRPFLFRRNIGDEPLPFPPEDVPNIKWDLVCSFDVLEHAEDEQEVLWILKEFASKSKRQFHRVNTGQHAQQAFDGDGSHGVKMPLSVWHDLARRAEAFYDQHGSIVIVE